MTDLSQTSGLHLPTTAVEAPTPPDPGAVPAVPTIRSLIEEHVGKAITLHAMGEEVQWDYSLRNDMQQGALAVVAMWVKGIILGSHFNFTFEVNPISLTTQQGAQQIIGEALQAALHARTEQTAAMQAEIAKDGPPLTGPGGHL